jgi:hypothetical protein
VEGGGREGVGVYVNVSVSEQEKAERSRQDGNARVTRPGTRFTSCKLCNVVVVVVVVVCLRRSAAADRDERPSTKSAGLRAVDCGG